MASKSKSHGDNGNGASRHRPATRNPARPVFAQPEPTEDPKHFRIKHASDAQAYKAIDTLNAEHKLKAMAFPPPRGGDEPQLTLEQVLGGTDGAPDDVKAQAKKTCNTIQKSGQIISHALGDCGSTRGPASENLVVDKLLGDFKESDPKEVPQFHFLMGDIVYSFGETAILLHQFYEPYRDYPAPILAAAGNHDGMISPLHGATSLEAYLRNFCAEDFAVTPEAGRLRAPPRSSPACSSPSRPRSCASSCFTATRWKTRA